MSNPTATRPGGLSYEETVARMEQATARQLLSVLTAIQMGHVLPVFAQSETVREALGRAAA